MVEFKIQIEEGVVEKFGYKKVEEYLQEFVKKMLLKSAAKDAIEDLKTIEIENNKEWQLARKLAWEQEKSNYLSDK